MLSNGFRDVCQQTPTGFQRGPSPAEASGKINFLMTRDIIIKTCEDGVDDMISIPETAEIYEHFQYADGSFEYIIVDDYTTENIHAMTRYRNDYDVISYNNIYIMILVNAIEITGADIIKDRFEFAPAYVRLYKENPKVWDQAKERFGVDLSTAENFTEEQMIFLQNNVTFNVAFMKICECCDVSFLVNKVHVRTKTGTKKCAIEQKKLGICSTFDTQYDLCGVSDDIETIYSEFCSKEEYDNALCKALSAMGIKKFEV